MGVLEFLYRQIYHKGRNNKSGFTERTSEHELDKFKPQRLKGRNNKSGLTENSQEHELPFKCA